MSERRRIEDRLRKKEQEIIALEEQIKSARIYIQALQDVLKILPKHPETLVSAESVLRSGSAVALTRDIILKAGKPVHITDIISALDKEPTKENRASLTGSLAAYVRKGEIFTRSAPNTFGLLELGHRTVEDDGPPADFGQVRMADPARAAPRRDLDAPDEEDTPF